MVSKTTHKYSVSVIVPARDEEGTIGALVKRLPVMGKSTEVIFVEGFSKDGTWSEIQKVIKNKKSRLRIRAYKQKNKKGKAEAVRIGFEKAKGEILIILDGDITVCPEEMPRFYKLLATGKADFANGSRFVYSKERGAMHYINHTGNIFFSKVFSLMLKTKITDTLCGTKAIFKKDYKHILEVTKDFAKEDPYGDFTLFLGAALLGLKIKEVPVKYYARVYGKPKISRFRDGIRLLIVLWNAVKKLNEFSQI